MTDEQILDAKVEILRLLADGLAINITEASKAIGLSPNRVYKWCETDKDFHELMEATYQVQADKIEKGFIEGRNDIPKMMLLKGWRARYRENYKVEFTTEKVETFLQDLKEIGQKAAEKKEETPNESNN